LEDLDLGFKGEDYAVFLVEAGGEVLEGGAEGGAAGFAG